MLKVSRAQTPGHTTEAAGTLELVCVCGGGDGDPHPPEGALLGVWAWALASVIP